MQVRAWLLSVSLSFLSTLAPLQANAADIELPAFGDATSGIISQQQEYELGREWLRAYRSRIPTLDDPELQFYLEQMLFKLAFNSELRDHRLEMILINNNTMNAFAVPGGIIGVHTGLFRYADNEYELASVFAHEIAHLSQRHFARRLEQQKANQYLSMAGLLASLIVAATAGGDAGMAGMVATQAASLQNSLRYSRQNEQEADRIGIETLYRSDMDPRAAPAMFEAMLKATRYVGSRPPEFLLTHPLTESRISDARARARSYPVKQYPLDINYQLMKARALIAMRDNPSLSISEFKSELEGNTIPKSAARYGLAMSYLESGDTLAARDVLSLLLSGEPENIHYRMLDIAIDSNEKSYVNAIEKLQEIIKTYPNYYPAKFALAKNYQLANQYHEAELLLEDLLQTRPEDPRVWYNLAEVRGLAGNISGVHLARAEYFVLVGVFDKARQQLEFARKLVSSDYRQSAIIDQRLRDIEKMQKDSKI